MMEYSREWRGCPPTIVITLEPMPVILAPARLRKLHRSCTWGSVAASVIVVVPVREEASIMAFSVAVTLVSMSQRGAAWAFFASIVTWL